mmetsp:Transcript_25348/g.47624  ORF Transcript_25348/g.47624 Transcript_25348/m.47624 type:complete len:258 (-) Transcript_25348:8-781(-)
MASARWKTATTAVKIQNAAVAALSGVPHGIDGDTFFSPKIPITVRAAIPLMQNEEKCTKAVFREVMKLAVNALLKGTGVGDSSVIKCEDIEQLAKQAKTFSYHEISVVLTGVTLLVCTAVRNRTKVSVVTKDLKEMNMPEAQIDDIVKALRNVRIDLQDNCIKNRVRAPSLTSFRWRVDVAISTETLQKVFKPTILCETTTSNGETKTFEMPIEQFHHLRYNVAKVLRNMEEVERHPIMRLAFQSDREAFDKGENNE